MERVVQYKWLNESLGKGYECHKSILQRSVYEKLGTSMYFLGTSMHNPNRVHIDIDGCSNICTSTFIFIYIYISIHFDISNPSIYIFKLHYQHNHFYEDTYVLDNSVYYFHINIYLIYEITNE